LPTLLNEETEASSIAENLHFEDRDMAAGNNMEEGRIGVDAEIESESLSLVESCL
jgi:hypothetical protein